MASVSVGTADDSRWQKLASAVLASEGAPENSEISLLFVDEDRMAELNEQHMGSQYPTDVLAFPIDETWRADRSREDSSRAENSRSSPSAVPILIGDVVICPEQCQDEDGIAMRVVHGVLHLCGYDHAETQDAAQMFSLQQRYIKLFDTSPADQPVA